MKIKRREKDLRFPLNSFEYVGFIIWVTYSNEFRGGFWTFHYGVSHVKVLHVKVSHVKASHVKRVTYQTCHISNVSHVKRVTCQGVTCQGVTCQTCHMSNGSHVKRVTCQTGHMLNCVIKLFYYNESLNLSKK